MKRHSSLNKPSIIQLNKSNVYSIYLGYLLTGSYPSRYDNIKNRFLFYINLNQNVINTYFILNSIFIL